MNFNVKQEKQNYLQIFSKSIKQIKTNSYTDKHVLIQV